ncbi:hypothetical protein AAG906_006361 [Vitis piasezkii]|uniref:uncharacterized protein LOC117910542 n=1 Tax=Vitis riparia TaxID=96939 RepID=UPI00155A3169|nr:uncharacterized protein LOC117910542 [Vitis riparia]
MACLVCISFSLPHAASQTLIEEKNQRKSAVGRLSSQATTRTGMKLLTPITSDRSISSVEDWSFLPHKMAPGRRFWEPVSLHLNVSAGTETVICGYWVGPDIEDGWGFVNAFVNQIL